MAENEGEGRLRRGSRRWISVVSLAWSRSFLAPPACTLDIFLPLFIILFYLLKSFDFCPIFFVPSSPISLSLPFSLYLSMAILFLWLCFPVRFLFFFSSLCDSSNPFLRYNFILLFPRLFVSMFLSLMDRSVSFHWCEFWRVNGGKVYGCSNHMPLVLWFFLNLALCDWGFDCPLFSRLPNRGFTWTFFAVKFCIFLHPFEFLFADRRSCCSSDRSATSFSKLSILEKNTDLIWKWRKNTDAKLPKATAFAPTTAVFSVVQRP